MWGSTSSSCEKGCQCSDLITDNFRINSGNSATKRKQEEAKTINYRSKMVPHSLDLNKKLSPLNSPISTPSKRRVLGEIQSSPMFRTNSPIIESLRGTPYKKKSPNSGESFSPVTSRSNKIKRSRLSRVYEERSKFKEDKENRRLNMCFGVHEETRDCVFSGRPNISLWSHAKLNFSDALPPKPVEDNRTEADFYVPQKEQELDQEFESLHDLEQEFDSENFDTCTKYEIISTDSPDIISSGRATSRKINSKNFEFGAPLLETEQSTSFNRQLTNVTRMLTFDNDFEFTSPAKRHTVSVKKSLKFTDSPEPTLRVPITPQVFPSESTTTSIESGFVSEFEEPFLEIDESSSSPKIDSIKDLITADITDFGQYTKKCLQRSISYNPEVSRAKVALFPIVESPVKKSHKRGERNEEEFVMTKRKKSNNSPLLAKVERQRPVLQRAFSENNASIMSAMARSAVDPDLIGDFSLPFALPLTIGDHSDLKSVSCETLASLLRGEYNDSINEFQVIDCRYPYEYDGGHILGALNMYTPAQIQTLVNEFQPREGDKRNILIFHCEFSLERGPKLTRYLRSSDRAKNKENYPSLCYPEVYLLHEGYRAFYQRFPDLCSPAGYTAMLDPQHKHLLRKHRSVQQPSSSHSMRRTRLML